jgi:hypothetical protein
MSSSEQPVRTTLTGANGCSRASASRPASARSPGEHASNDHKSARQEGYDVNALAALKSLPPLISIPIAAKLLGISRSAAYRYAAMGDLPTRHLGGRVYIVTSLLHELISNADNRSEAA